MYQINQCQRWKEPSVTKVRQHELHFWEKWSWMKDPKFKHENPRTHQMFVRTQILDKLELHFKIKITVVWLLYKYPVPWLQWPNCKKPQKGQKMSNLWCALALGLTIFYCESSERNESFEASTELTIFRKCLSLSLVAHQKGS